MRLLALAFALGAAFLLASCGEDGPLDTTIEVLGGPCEECPTERLDSLMGMLKKQGVEKYTYDEKTGQLDVTYDSLKILRRDIVLFLTENGYGADMQAGLDVPNVACCASNTLLSLDPDNDELADLELDLDESIDDELDEMVELESDLDDMVIDEDEIMEDIPVDEEDFLEDLEDEDELYKRL